jgi:hypothetical protein
MRLHLRKLIILHVFVCLAIGAFSQEAAHEALTEKKEEKEKSAHHRITVAIMHAHIPTISEGGSKKTFAVPAWAFDYDYWFNEKWAVGLHNDLIIQQFKVEKGGTEIERNNPIAVALVGLFKPAKHLTFIGGIGREFEKTESFNLIDIGLEYGWELPKEWEISLNLKYENKFEAYNTWLFGVGISKSLR